MNFSNLLKLTIGPVVFYLLSSSLTHIEKFLFKCSQLALKRVSPFSSIFHTDAICTLFFMSLTCDLNRIILMDNYCILTVIIALEVMNIFKIVENGTQRLNYNS